MTVKQLLEWVDSVRPNQLKKTVKVGFINDIECRVLADVFHQSMAGFVPYDEYSDDDTLLVEDPFSCLYQWYLAAMVSAAAGNNQVFQYDMSLFQQYWGEYAAYFVREHGR